MEERIRAGGSVSAAVVRMVSDAESCPQEALPPLYDAVDPDALDALCADASAGSRQAPSTISFDYSDSRVVVGGCESITVTPLAKTGPAEQSE